MTFRAVFDAEFSYVCRVLRRFGADEADVEDLAQEVFVTVHAKFGDYDRAKPVRPWLTAFAFRVAANSKRVRRYRRELGESSVEFGSAKTPEDELSDREAQRLVLATLAELPFDRRAALVMHDLEGLSAAEIASALSIPLGTVYSRVHTARGEFREIIGRLRRRGGES